MVSKVRLTAVKLVDRNALAHPGVAAVLDHEARLASDPVIQERNKKTLAAHRREMLPLYVIAALLAAAICGSAAWFLPGIVSPVHAIAAFAATLVFLSAVMR